MKKIRIKIILFLIVSMITISANLKAQGPVFDPDVDDVPFDGGISLLVAVGVGYGIKKALQQRKLKNYN